MHGIERRCTLFLILLYSHSFYGKGWQKIRKWIPQETYLTSFMHSFTLGVEAMLRSILLCSFSLRFFRYVLKRVINNYWSYIFPYDFFVFEKWRFDYFLYNISRRIYSATSNSRQSWHFTTIGDFNWYTTNASTKLDTRTGTNKSLPPFFLIIFPLHCPIAGYNLI